MATTTVRLPDDLKRQATECAEALGISLNAVMNIALDTYLYQRKYRMAQFAEPEEQADTSGQEQVVSRNALCPCGSGKKYKRCCGV
jgi:uncharacterized protein YecA (UPF0149 family)